MKLTKRQKVCIAGLAAAVAIMVADRVFFGLAPTTPEQATADDIQSPLPQPSQTAEPLADETPGESSPMHEDSLAMRLEALWKTEDLDWGRIPDPFVPPDAWAAELPSETKAVSQQTPAERFARLHRLEAVLMVGGAGFAVVGDKCVPVGQELDGFKLVSVGERSAVWESDGAGVTLVLPDGM